MKQKILLFCLVALFGGALSADLEPQSFTYKGTNYHDAVPQQVTKDGLLWKHRDGHFVMDWDHVPWNIKTRFEAEWAGMQGGEIQGGGSSAGVSTPPRRPATGTAASLPEPREELGSVRLDVKTVRAGRQHDYSYRTRWGSYNRTTARSRDLEVEVVNMGNETLNGRVEVFFIGRMNSELVILQIFREQADLATMVPYTVTVSGGSETKDVRYVLSQYRFQSGVDLEGWVARFINEEGQVIAASSRNLEELPLSGRWPDMLRSAEQPGTRR